MKPDPGFEPGPHWREAGAFATTPPITPCSLLLAVYHSRGLFLEAPGNYRAR